MDHVIHIRAATALYVAPPRLLGTSDAVAQSALLLEQNYLDNLFYYIGNIKTIDIESRDRYWMLRPLYTTPCSLQSSHLSTSKQRPVIQVNTQEEAQAGQLRVDNAFNSRWIAEADKCHEELALVLQAIKELVDMGMTIKFTTGMRGWVVCKARPDEDFEMGITDVSQMD
ncbi:hypothetical protein BT96DRAFT_947129 [Gymnopus androsaceus JB14]|uniref:Uncharacterized protein n=1 Tax=Gymnopus androsaceus JB14 TaxID=1447944 RepID=A0A6A4GVI1_9AGAR|nr:hypothetical protein BT96DRAFT_947129 [Gymnopus androsaceus JB14]